IAKAGSSGRRRVLIRRVYADPKLLGANRSLFIASGFEVIDSPLLEGRSRNAADVSLSLDVVDALGHPTGYDEFILLSADIDLTPLLFRLRAHNRTTAVYVTPATPAAYRAIPDAVVDEVGLLQLLSTKSVPVPAQSDTNQAQSAPPIQAGERADIEVLARKIHNATSVPLFSPRAFADLFRILAQEIAENGYHFQNTAENVANKLTAAGRNVTRRQVVFVVKGLALKGHVFSTTDTAEKLAEVFREQVLYLVGNSGLELDEREKALLPSWIAGRASVSPAAPAAAPATPPEPATESTALQADEPKPAKRKAAKVAPPPAPRPAPVAAKPASAPAPKPPAKPVEIIAEKPEPVPAPKPMPERPPPVVAPPAPTRSIEEIKAAVAARAAAMKTAANPAFARPKPTAAAAPRPVQGTGAPTPARPAPPAPASRPQAPPAAPAAAAPAATQRPAPPLPMPARQTQPGAAERPAASPPRPTPAPPPAAARPPQAASKEALESSILAAIAQAVDVLVEDSAKAEGREPEAPPMESPVVPEKAKPAAAPEPVSAEPADGGDIGDEIQKIIASYSRSRQQGEPQ